MIGRYIINKTDELAKIGSGVIGALTLGQFPEFLTQYQQRLGGHIDEISNLVNQYGYNDIIQRADTLQKSLEAITNAQTLEKLLVFLQNIDLGIAQKTLENYTPGLNFNETSLIYMGVGALTGPIIYWLSKEIFKTSKKILTNKPQVA